MSLETPISLKGFEDEEENQDIDHVDNDTLIPRFADNQNVLACTCALFFVFCIAEVMGALISNSLALLGDAAAMFVDV